MDSIRAFGSFRMKCKGSHDFLRDYLLSIGNSVHQSSLQINCRESDTPLLGVPDDDEQSEILNLYNSYVVEDASEQTVSTYFNPGLESNFTKVESTVTSIPSNVSTNLPEETAQAVSQPINNAKTKVECPDCGARIWNFRKHMETHKSDAERKKPYVCELCQRSYINRPSYIGHLNKHKNIRPYACDKCEKTFHGAANLRMHMNSHETTGKFRCNDCSKTFRYCHDLAKHRRIHMQSPVYACEHCDYKHVKLQYLKRHSLIHNSEYRFTCQHCAKGFNRKEYYRNHLQKNRCKRAVLPT